MKKRVLLILLLVSIVMSVVIIPSVSALVTQSGVTGNHSVGSDVVVTITGAASDKGDPCFYEWVNETGGLLENDTTCVIPSSSPFQLFQSHTVLAGEAPQVNLSGRLYVNDVFISQAFYNTTSTGGKNTLDITNVRVTSEIFEGRTAGVRGLVKSQGKLVGYADVCVDVLDENGEPFQHLGCKKSEADGDFFFSARCDNTNWCTAGVSYLLDIDASCPKNSSSYVSCINEDGDELDFATGVTTAPVTIVDIGDKIKIPKQYNASIFGVYMRNQFGAKVQMKKNPAFIAQEDIDWPGFNNTNTSFNVNQTGQAYLTAGELASICMLVNNTFPDELEIELDDVHFDDDTLQQLFHPLDAETGRVLRGGDFASFGIKPFEDEGILQEKCTDQFRIPMNIKGTNDWDVNFHFTVEGFVQRIEVESEEFNIYAQERGKDFVPIVDIKNVTISAFNTKVNACTDVNITINYDYFGVTEKSFVIIYEFEQTTSDVEIGRKINMISPDIGKNNNITDTLTLPFTHSSGEAEVVVTIWNNKINLGGSLVGFGDTEPHNTFNITADLSDSCRYRDTPDQFLQARQTRALEGINSSAGTFDFQILAADTDSNLVKVSGSGKTGQGQFMNRDAEITCQVQGFDFTAKTFQTFVTNEFSFSSIEVETPTTLGTYTMICTAKDSKFGTFVTDPAKDNFRVVDSLDTGATGGSTGTFQGFVEEAKELVDKVTQAGRDAIIKLKRSRPITQTAVGFGFITIFGLLVLAYRRFKDG